MQLPTSEQLYEQLARLEGLKQTMRARSVGGAERQGRYKKVDTARLSYVNSVAIPGLKLGKLVPESDWAMLFRPHDDQMHGPQLRAAYKWADDHHRDPRSRADMSRIDSSRQRTLLEWAEQNPAAFYKPACAPRGAPHVYRFTFGSYVKYTVQVMRASSRTLTSTSHNSTPITTHPHHPFHIYPPSLHLTSTAIITDLHTYFLAYLLSLRAALGSPLSLID